MHYRRHGSSIVFRGNHQDCCDYVGGIYAQHHARYMSKRGA
jgi:hypothetical protein